jgi:hypothetical protein
MKRKIYGKLLEWKAKSRGRTAVMIDGAQRVGKSWIAEAFAKNEYASHLVLDFSKAQPRVKRIFNEYLGDLDTFFLYLQEATGTRLTPGNSLVVFDEVQKFPRAREAIKHLVADGRYHYLETGSLISIDRNVKDIVVPSEERRMPMWPMDFEEFLWALGDEATMELVRDAFAKRRALGAETHRAIMDRFRQYLVVGGMPQAVAEFAESRDLEAVDAVKRDILALYRADIHKSGGGGRHRILSVFDGIPAQLSRHEKRFVLAEARKGGRMRDFDGAFAWLQGAMTVNLCWRACEPNVGLDLHSDRAAVKCYLGDTGLLLSQAFSESAVRAGEIHRRILLDKIEINEGMLVENAVAQMLRAAGHELFYFSDSGRNGSGERMEIDFLLDSASIGRRHNICPVEVKSAKQYATASLKKFREKYGKFLAESYVLHPRDVAVQDGVVYLPLYMASLLAEGNDAGREPVAAELG